MNWSLPNTVCVESYNKDLTPKMHGGSNLNKKCVIKYELKTLFGVVSVHKKSHFFYNKSQRLIYSISLEEMPKL